MEEVVRKDRIEFEFEFELLTRASERTNECRTAFYKRTAVALPPLKKYHPV